MATRRVTKTEVEVENGEEEEEEEEDVQTVSFLVFVKSPQKMKCFY